jgi:hypothetical protein
MGYIVRSLTGKRTWKVQYQTYKGGRRAKDITEVDYLRLGIHSRMDIEEVRTSIRQLNSQLELKRLQERRLAIGSRLKEEDLKSNAFLPDALRQEFEDNFIDVSTKKVSHWRTAKKLIIEISLAPHDWEYYRGRWYSLFKKKGYSYDYIQKLTLILNRWGKFIAYKQKSFFEPIPMARGMEKQRIVDARPSEVTKESLPLTPKLLEGIREQLKEEQWAWLYISLWFGLRPSEVDGLQGLHKYRLEDNVLWVYQTKLAGIAAKDRWKPIPIKYPEQQKALQLIQSEKYSRPLNKTLKKLLDGQYTCYAGRKGFTDLMLEKGSSLEAISQWLGHRSINRTWKNYKDKKKVLL